MCWNAYPADAVTCRDHLGGVFFLGSEIVLQAEEEMAKEGKEGMRKGKEVGCSSIWKVRFRQGGSRE